MRLFYNNRKNLLHKILVKNAMRKNKPNAQSPFEGKGRITKKNFPEKPTFNLLTEDHR
jgi:hypothetical protein